MKPTWHSVAFALWVLGMLVLSVWLWGKLRSLRRALPGQVTQDALPESLLSPGGTVCGPIGSQQGAGGSANAEHPLSGGDRRLSAGALGARRFYQQALAARLEVLETQRQELKTQLQALEIQTQQIRKAAAEQAPQGQNAGLSLQRIQSDLRARETARFESLADEARAKQAQAREQQKLLDLLTRVQKVREVQKTDRPGPQPFNSEAQQRDWRQWQQEMEAWAHRMEDYGRQMEAWTKSPQFQAFQQRMDTPAEKWSQKVQRLLFPPHDGQGLAPADEMPVPRLGPRLSPPQLAPVSPLSALPRVPTLSPLPGQPLRPSVPPTVPEPLFPDLRVGKPLVLPTPAVQVTPPAVLRNRVSGVWDRQEITYFLPIPIPTPSRVSPPRPVEAKGRSWRCGSDSQVIAGPSETA